MSLSWPLRLLILLGLSLAFACTQPEPEAAEESKVSKEKPPVPNVPDPVPDAPLPDVPDDDNSEELTPINVSSVLMPADSTYGENAEIEFQVTYPEQIEVLGNPRIGLTLDSGTVWAQYITGSGSSILTFKYQVQLGDHDSDGIQVTPDINVDMGSLNAGEAYSVQTNLWEHLGSASGILIDTNLAPPAQVAVLTTAPTTTTELSASWSAPSSSTPISHYILQYREEGAISWTTLSPHPELNSAKISGLAANTLYEIRVAASNGVLGPFSEPQTAEIFDVMGLNPIAWLDAADPMGTGELPIDGSLISAWVDKTGAAEDATEEDPNKQPFFERDVHAGLPAIRFDNLDRGLQGGFTRTQGTDLTIFIVGQYDASYSDRCMFEFIGPEDSRAFFIDRRYAGNTHYSPELTKGSFQLWTINNAGYESIIKENRTTTLYNATNDFNTDFVGNGTYFLGDDSTGGNRMHGYIGEILIFDRALDQEDLSRIEKYLQTKWGLY